MKTILTAYEASLKYGFSPGHLRLLMRQKKVKGRSAQVNSKSKIWLIEEASLKRYLSKDRKPGRKPKG